jgi:hypothetical protein
MTAISINYEFYAYLEKRLTQPLHQCPYSYKLEPELELVVSPYRKALKQRRDPILYYAFMDNDVVGILHGVCFRLDKKHCTFRTHLFNQTKQTSWELSFGDRWDIESICDYITNLHWLLSALGNLEYHPEDPTQELWCFHKGELLSAEWVVDSFCFSGGLLYGQVRMLEPDADGLFCKEQLTFPVYLYQAEDWRDFLPLYQVVVRDVLFDTLISDHHWERIKRFDTVIHPLQGGVVYVLNWCARFPVASIRMRAYQKAFAFLYHFYSQQTYMDSPCWMMANQHSSYFFTPSSASQKFYCDHADHNKHDLESIESDFSRLRKLWFSTFTGN